MIHAFPPDHDHHPNARHSPCHLSGVWPSRYRPASVPRGCRALSTRMPSARSPGCAAIRAGGLPRGMSSRGCRPPASPTASRPAPAAHWPPLARSMPWPGRLPRVRPWRLLRRSVCPLAARRLLPSIRCRRRRLGWVVHGEIRGVKKQVASTGRRLSLGPSFGQGDEPQDRLGHFFEAGPFQG